MTNAWKSGPPTVTRDAVVKKKVSTVNSDDYAVTEERDYTLSWND
jgi:hypothetical protein